MTSPCKLISITCPGCGATYTDSYRPSINLTLDDFDDDYLDEVTSSTCPHCNYKVRHNVLTVRKDGVWVIGGDGSNDG